MSWLLGAGVLALIFALNKRGGPQTPWTNAGLPTPVGSVSELYYLARRVVDSIRLSSVASSRPQILELQRRAGLVTLDPESEIAVASGQYDARTRQAVGWYGRYWQEETP